MAEAEASRVESPPRSNKPLSPPPPMASPLGRYVVALLSVLSALLLQKALWPFMSTSPFLFFFAAVMLASWWGGWGPGLLAIGLSLVATDYFFLSPAETLRVPPGHATALVIFTLLALLVTRLNVALRRTSNDRAALLERERRARAESEAERARFHSLLMQAPAFVALFRGPDHLCILSNPLNTELMGQRELLGKCMRETVPGRLPEDVLARLDHVYKTGEPFTGQELAVKVPQADGSEKEIFLNFVFQPTRDALGHIDGVACFGFDVTPSVLARRQAEALTAELQRSKERYRSFVSQSTEGIFRVETVQPISVDLPEEEQVEAMLRDGYIAECNDAMARMYSLESAAIFIGTRLGQILVREDPHNMAYMRTFVRNGYRVENEESHEVAHDGTRRVFLNNLIGVVESNHLVAAWGLQRDVTEQRRAEEALRHSEERLRIAVSSASIGTWDLNLSTGAYQWDERCQQLFGLPKETPLSIDAIRAHMHPEDRERFDAAVAHALNQESGGDFRAEYRMVGRDGVERWLSVHGRAFFDEQGRPVRFTGTALDVSERRRAEANARFLAEASAVLASSLDYEAILRNMARLTIPALADWCFVDLMQPDGTFKRVEVATASAADAELAARAQRFGLVPEDNPEHLPTRAFLRQQSILIEHFTPGHIRESASSEEHARLMQTIQPVSFIAVPLVERGRAFGVLSFFTTRSGRRYTTADLAFLEELSRRVALSVENARLYREAQDAIRLRDEFLSIASHELKTPLTPLSLKLQMLSREVKRQPESPLRRSVEDYIVTGTRQVKKLSELVSDLLDVTRIAGGRLRLEPEQVSLDALVREVTGRYEPEAARLGSSLQLDIQDAVIGHWDRLRLEQVITNLVDNAIKYGAGKPIHVRLNMDSDRVALHVRDEGIGIAPEHLSRIFGRFERAVSERHYGGLGLGLYITRTIVEAMGGSIHVESAPGQGATFTVVLPCRPEEPAAAPPPVQ